MKETNQAANFALLEWPDNLDTSDTSPVEYAPEMRKRFSQEAWGEMCRLPALPERWETLGYSEFLEQRRRLMAAVVRQGFEALA